MAVAAVVLSVMIGSGINFTFLKILFVFCVGVLIVYAGKKIYDAFKK